MQFSSYLTDFLCILQQKQYMCYMAQIHNFEGDSNKDLFYILKYQ